MKRIQRKTSTRAAHHDKEATQVISSEQVGLTPSLKGGEGGIRTRGRV